METRPTNSELEILTVLWRRGPSSVREVHEELNARKQTGYTTVLKLLQIMAEKGLVTRDEESRAHIYTAKSAQSETQTNLVQDLVERAFGGSAHQLAMHALGSKKASPEELAEIRRLLDEMEKGS
ncbi:MAG TPA: BlaI/MecI/CopY family transcriptional regulator [Fimbriimonas sp.]|nr:BlaI/MecI/CopY family transcriptional regulator [Fimbriimonas sp.]